jgi:hypothetical protein
MPCPENDSLLGFEPIVEAIITLAWGPDGWDLTVNHRHCAGRFGACGRSTYEALSLDEIVDVVAATTAGYGPFASPNGLGDPPT